MTKYTFSFVFRLACEDYKYNPAHAGDDDCGAVETAQAALLPMWNHKSREPLDYARDIAPRISLTVVFIGFDRLNASPDQSANWLATVTSEDIVLLRDLRRYASDEWNDGETADYPIHAIVEETEADLAHSAYATCAACGFSTDRCVERDGRFLCVPCDDHEQEEG